MDPDHSALDFKALRAKFQEEEVLLKQPRMKPTLPEKPRLTPLPLSPTSPIHSFTLPAGARPSLLTSINQAVEGKTTGSPRVLFKDDKKEGKRPLLGSKKEKSEGKSKWGKDKNGGMKLGKEKPETEALSKAEGGASELVPAKPPPKTAPKKKGFLLFRKSLKKEAPAESILDTPSPDISAPLIPITPALTPDEAAPEHPATPKLRALLPPTPTPALPDSAGVAIIPPDPAPDPAQDPTPDPALAVVVSASAAVPDETPPPSGPALEIETPAETPPDPPAPATVSHSPPLPPSPMPTPVPPPALLAVPIPAPTPTPPPPASPALSPPPSPVPEPEAGAEAVVDAGAAEEAGPPASPLPPAAEPPSTPPASPQAEQPVSPLTALERAEEMSPGKKTLSPDQRIFNALEKARRKFGSPLTTPTTSTPVTPTPEDNPRPISPAFPLPELPPVDYGADPKQASPVLEGIAEEGGDIVPELLVVPPPPPRKPLPEVQSLGPPPEKPPRPPTVDLTSHLTTPVDQSAVVEIPPPPEFLEPDPAPDAPETEDVGSEALESECVELQALELLESERTDSEPRGPELLGADDLLDGAAQEVQQQEEEEEEEVEEEPEDPQVPGFGGVEFQEIPELVPPSPPDSALQAPDPAPSSPVSQDAQPIPGPEAENGDATSTGKLKGPRAVIPKKRKGPPKNPYVETQPATEVTPKNSWFSKNEKKSTPEGPDEKELKKKEKQRLEKEKKEQKEQREREKKEQKEQEKKRNEMKKTFKITGQEEAMYAATVMVDCKGRKNDLAVNSGDVISIIRTTNCPKGKWLAKDSSNTYGYISVSHVELDIKEMLELGKKASQAVSQRNSTIESEALSMESRNSNHYPVSTGSFSDDSEEWMCDDDDVLSPTESIEKGHSRTLSMPEMGSREPSIHHQHAISEPITDMNIQARHEALQKLSTFLYPPQDSSQAVVEESAASPEEEIFPVFEEAEPVCSTPDEVDVDLTDMIILPPPDLYADIMMAE